jgi:hypothetical protein
MSGFASRQVLIQSVPAVAAVAIVAIIAAMTGPHLAQAYHAVLASCGQGECGTALESLAGQDGGLRLWLGVLVVVFPALAGMFWGAPLVARELETGTFRLAWTQSVTRTRWLAARLVVTGLASMCLAVVLSFIVTWWASPLDKAGMDQFASFDERGIVPAGYAVFAFVLGVAAGALVRRTLTAMLTTLVVFVTIRVSFRIWVRPHLLSPVTDALALNPASTGYGSSGFLPFPATAALQPASPDIPNAWITSIGIVNRDGAALTGSELARTCPGLGGDRGLHGGLTHTQAPASVVNRMHDCVARLGTSFHEVVTYQPATRYWPLQWYELASYVGAALVLAGLCVWRVRHI